MKIQFIKTLLTLVWLMPLLLFEELFKAIKRRQKDEVNR